MNDKKQYLWGIFPGYECPRQYAQGATAIPDIPRPGQSLQRHLKPNDTQSSQSRQTDSQKIVKRRRLLISGIVINLLPLTIGARIPGAVAAHTRALSNFTRASWDAE